MMAMANFILLLILKAVVGTMYRIRPRIQYLNI